jgi:hypothetical protein
MVGGRYEPSPAAARTGKRAERDFDEMLDAWESLALGAGAHQLRASVNFAREQAHRKLAVRGFRAERVGIVMQSPNNLRTIARVTT